MNHVPFPFSQSVAEQLDGRSLPLLTAFDAPWGDKSLQQNRRAFDVNIEPSADFSLWAYSVVNTSNYNLRFDNVDQLDEKTDRIVALNIKFRTGGFVGELKHPFSVIQDKLLPTVIPLLIDRPCFDMFRSVCWCNRLLRQLQTCFFNALKDVRLYWKITLTDYGDESGEFLKAQLASGKLVVVRLLGDWSDEHKRIALNYAFIGSVQFITFDFNIQFAEFIELFALFEIDQLQHFNFDAKCQFALDDLYGFREDMQISIFPFDGKKAVIQWKNSRNCVLKLKWIKAPCRIEVSHELPRIT